MPWKPPTVRNYSSDWQKARKVLLRAEPLCRLCLAAGRTVGAAVVDHIVPLTDGGTHATDNLMPLCKSCHDSLKTPADVRARERAAYTTVRLVAVDFGAPASMTKLNAMWDARVVRLSLSFAMGFEHSHRVSLAAAEGVLAAARRGDLPAINLLIVCDDCQWAAGASQKFGVPCGVEPMNDIALLKGAAAEQTYLRKRYSVEYIARHGTQTTGNQDSSSRTSTNP